MIIFKDVFKTYGNNIVLNDISLSIEGREFVVIVGPSGAGKTTLINALIGAEKVSSGSILVDGYEITSLSSKELPSYRRKLGIIFQDYKLLPQKTVYENISFAMEVCGNSDESIAFKVPEVLETVGLYAQKDLFPTQLSGGEKQRAAIARALINDPKLLIADEPTGNLDPDNTKSIIELLLKINKNGTTVILASHDREMVDMINRRVIRLERGDIVSDKSVSGYTDKIDLSFSENSEVMELHIEG